MEGERWIDEIMAPLSSFQTDLVKPPGARGYNTIYAIVSDLEDPIRGQALVEAIVAYIEVNRTKQDERRG